MPSDHKKAVLCDPTHVWSGARSSAWPNPNPRHDQTNIFTCFYTSLNIDHLRCGAQLRSTILDRTPIVAFARPICFFLCSFHPEYVLAFAGSPWNPLSWRWFTWLSIVCCFYHQDYHHCHHSHQDQHFQEQNLHLALCSTGFPWNARWLVVVHFVGQLQDKSLTLEQALYPLRRNLKIGKFTSSMFVAHLYISGRLGLASQWKTGKPPDKDPLVAKRPFLDDIFVWNHKKLGYRRKYDVMMYFLHIPVRSF